VNGSLGICTDGGHVAELHIVLWGVFGCLSSFGVSGGVNINWRIREGNDSLGLCRHSEIQ
jgi:hypothetical protein